MNSSFVYSLSAHFLIGLLLFITVPSWKSDDTVNKSAVLWVDLNRVEVSNKTNLPPQKKEVKTTPTEPKKIQPAQPVQKPVTKTQKPVEPVQKKVKQENAVPVVEEKVKPKPQPPKVKEKPKVVPKQTKPKPPEKKIPKETPDDSMDSLLSSVEEISKSDAMQKAKEKSEMSNVVDSVLDGFSGSSSFDAQSKISADMMAYISSVIGQRCWKRVEDTNGLESMIVVVEVALSPDGRVTSADVIDDINRIKTDSTYRAVAESAKRAVHNCDNLDADSPFVQLARKHPTSYKEWQNLKLHFNPMDM